MIRKGKQLFLTAVWHAMLPNAASLIAGLLTLEGLRVIKAIGPERWPMHWQFPMALILLALATLATLLNYHVFRLLPGARLNASCVVAWVYLVTIFLGTYSSYGSAYTNPVDLFATAVVYFAIATAVFIWLPVRIIYMLRKFLDKSQV